MSAAATARTATPPARQMLAVILIVPAVVALALWAFAWPTARIAPRDLPVGVAGPAAATASIQHQLAERDGAFDVHRYADEAAARAAIEAREVYGAVVVTAQGPKLLTATAASPAVAQLLQEAASHQAPPGTRPRTEDVVAAPASDPRGAALGSSLLPLSLAGVAAGAVATLLGLRGTRAVAALTGASVLAGLVVTTIADTWLSIVTGDWWLEAGALTLTVLAASAAVAGFAALLGRSGIGVGALLIVLIGNPWSGVTSAPHLLPEPAGLIGQWLPPGAGGSLLRSVAFFDGSGAGAAITTLAVWAAVGLTAVALNRPRGREAAAGSEHRSPAGAPAPAA
ncbi:ABC transporter permease [Streptomyces sp. NPDC048639]|uniref:ABC transporter permease n=1 Tax=Streptomyces sp. NPDC048639 TaxID=3365581 RepID=UPI003710F265